MGQYKDINVSDKHLTQSIRRKYGDEGVFDYYTHKFNVPFTEVVERYYNGESMKNLAKELNISLRLLKFLFTFANVKLRTLEERMEILNKVTLPNLMMEKYGVTNIFATEECKQKIKETNLKKYGVENYSSTEECREKVKNTFFKKYGTTNIFSSEYFRNNYRNFIIKKFGSWENFVSQSSMNRYNSIILKYGNLENYNASKLENFKKTCLKKYGVDNPFKLEYVIELTHSDEVIQKSLETKIKNGIAIPIEDVLLNNFRNYTMIVRSLTRKNYRKYKNYINPNNLPRSRKDYNLDHIMSIFDSYLQNLTPEQCAHPCNLRLIPANDNYIKNLKSDISKSELLNKIEAFENEISKKNKNSK